MLFNTSFKESEFVTIFSPLNIGNKIHKRWVDIWILMVRLSLLVVSTFILSFFMPLQLLQYVEETKLFIHIWMWIIWKFIIIISLSLYFSNLRRFRISNYIECIVDQICYFKRKFLFLFMFNHEYFTIRSMLIISLNNRLWFFPQRNHLINVTHLSPILRFISSHCDGLTTIRIIMVDEKLRMRYKWCSVFELGL